MSATAQFWLGFGGSATVLVLSTRWMRGLVANLGQRRQLLITEEHLKQVWALPSTLCVVTENEPPLWLFADEFAAAHWSALRRFLRQSLRRQALGLSISR